MSVRRQGIVRWIVALLVALAGAGWLLLTQMMGSPVVCVVNQSSHPLGDVLVTTSGGSRSFGKLDPHERRCCPVEARGESGLAISFVGGGKSASAEDLAYLESSGGYCEVLRISEGFTVTSLWREGGCGLFESLACRLTRRCS
jgi:hypothetical protein